MEEKLKMAKTLYERGGLRVSVSTGGGVALLLIGLLLVLAILVDELSTKQILVFFAGYGIAWLGVRVLADSASDDRKTKNKVN